MKRTMVRYKLKPERVEEHEALLRAVFAELASTTPEALRYGAFKQPDGLSFVHLAFVDGPNNPLEACAAFKAFTAQVRERCEEPPVALELSAIGTYGL